MARINLNLRDSRSNVATPINIVVRWNGQRLVYPSGEKVVPKAWSIKAQRANGSLPTSPEFNTRLSGIVTKVENTYLRFLNDNDQRAPSIGELRDQLDIVIGGKGKDGPRTLFAFIEQYITEVRNGERVNERTAGNLAKTTIKKYCTTLEHLRAFSKAKGMRVDFDTVNLAFYRRFLAYLTTDKGLALNSVGKYIQTVKVFLRAAVEDDTLGVEVHPAFSTKKFKAPKEPSDKIYLTAKELNDLFHLDLSGHPGMDRARDLFIIGAWTGLRYGDWSSIGPERVIGDRIRIDTEKTGATVTIPMNTCVRAIFNKYGNKLPPSISNQKMNAHIRKFAAMVPSLSDMASVSSTVAGKKRRVTKAKAEMITTHTARRSFATNAYKGDGYKGPVPVRAIMAITGHTTEQSFRVYICMTSEEFADQFETYMDKTAPLAVVG